MQSTKQFPEDTGTWVKKDVKEGNGQQSGGRARGGTRKEKQDCDAVFTSTIILQTRPLALSPPRARPGSQETGQARVWKPFATISTSSSLPEALPGLGAGSGLGALC